MIGIFVGQTIIASFDSTSLYTYSIPPLKALPVEDIIHILRNCKYKSAGNEPFCYLGVQDAIIDASSIAATRTGDLYPADEFAMVYLVPTHNNQTLLQVFNVPIPEAATLGAKLEYDTWRLVYEEVIPESLSPHLVHQVPVVQSYLKLTGALL